MRLAVRHRTSYRYSQSVSQSINQLCLLPPSDRRQRCLASRVTVQPEPESIRFGTDCYGNRIAHFGLFVPHRLCHVTVTSEVETNETLAPLPRSLGRDENRARLSRRGDPDALMAHDCLLPSPYVPPGSAAETLLDECPPTGLGVLEYAGRLMTHIHRSFRYDAKFSSLVTPIDDVVAARRGVCQDFAHLAIAALRRAGIPARYVSGYLETLPPPGRAKLRGADASHAWFSVYDAAGGWHDFDPTNDRRPDAQYVVTARGRDYGDVTPLKGIVYGGGRHRLSVEVDVDRVVPEDRDGGDDRDALAANDADTAAGARAAPSTSSRPDGHGDGEPRAPSSSPPGSSPDTLVPRPRARRDA